MKSTSGTTAAENSGEFDPRQAAELLEQVTRQARRTFATSAPALWVFRAVLVLVAFGGFWLSVRDRHPYSGPTGVALPVAFALVAINVAWSAWRIKRAATGVSGPAQRVWQVWTGVMAAVLVAAMVFTAPLYDSAGHSVWGLYQANVPLLIVGLVGAVTAASLRYWPIAGTLFAIAVVAAIAGFGGPAGAWLIMGIGLGAVCLGTAAFKARQQRRGVVQP